MVAGVVAMAAAAHGALAKGQYRADQQDLGFQPARAAKKRGEGMKFK